MSVPPRAQLPVGVEPLRISTHRTQLAALRCGDPTADPVLLVPGFTGSKEDFLPILRPLADAGFHVTAIDQRGQFESPGSGRGGDYSLAAFAADLVAVLAQADRPTHLVGHSFGGLVAREATLERPDAVASLTLMDSGPGQLPQSRWPLLQALIGLVPLATPEQIWEAKLEMDRQVGAPPLPPAVAQFLRSRWVASDAWSMAGIAEVLLTAPDRTHELAAVVGPDRPALVMYGEHDETAWLLPDLVTMAQHLSATMVPIRDAAHSPAVENPAATATALIEFISDV